MKKIKRLVLNMINKASKKQNYFMFKDLNV